MNVDCREIAYSLDAASSALDRIDLRDARSVELWCAALRVTTAELVQAVALVGTSGEDVASYLRARHAAPSAKPFM